MTHWSAQDLDNYEKKQILSRKRPTKRETDLRIMQESIADKKKPLKPSSVKNKKGVGKEDKLQLLVCNYLRVAYPDILWTCDLSSGMKLSIGQAVKAQRMRSDRGMPDVMVFAARYGKHGLFLELKREGTIIYLKNGQLTADKHIREQDAMLNRLDRNGYSAHFAVGFEQAKMIIDTYLG